VTSYPAVTHSGKPGWLGYISETPWGLDGIMADVMWVESPTNPTTEKPYPLPLFPQRYPLKDLTIQGTIALDEPSEAVEAEHTCHAMGCDRYTPPRYLMCARHWAMVPANLQAQVNQLYRPGQEVDKQPSPGYLNAARAAIAAVQRKEKAA
jgi:hypothetical protein